MGGNGIAAKTTREAGFPLAIGAMGMEIAIETAETSNVEDRARILNCIAGQSLDSEPLATHPLYTQTNKRLHAYFAAHLLLRAATSKSAATDAGRTLWGKIAHALQNDMWLKTVDWRLEGFTSDAIQLLLQ